MFITQSEDVFSEKILLYPDKKKFLTPMKLRTFFYTNLANKPTK